MTCQKNEKPHEKDALCGERPFGPGRECFSGTANYTILTKFQSKQKTTEAITLFYLISDVQITNAMLRASTRSAAVNKTGCLESVRTFPAISLNM